MTIRNQRILLGVLLLLSSVGLVCLNWALRDEIFYLKPHETPMDSWRLLWVAAFVPLGAGIRAFRWLDFNKNPWPQNARYLLNVSFAGLILFIVFHSVLDLDNWLFYPATAIPIVSWGMVPGRATTYFQKVINAFER